MRLRKPVLFLLLVTVLAPIVLYTHTLTTYFITSSSRNEFVEDVSTFTLGGEIRPLNVLPQESDNAMKEPLGVVYSENSRFSHWDNSDTLKEENARKARQLSEELLENETAKASNWNSTRGYENRKGENPIRQVTLEGRVTHHEDENRAKPIPNRSNGNSSRSHTRESAHTSDISPTNMKTRHNEHTYKASSQRLIRNNPKSQSNQVGPPDVVIRQLKDQLIRGRVYLSLSATSKNAHFIRELRLRMKEVQRAVGVATKDSELSRNAYEKLKAMEQTLAKGKQIQDDCSAYAKKLRAMLHSTEEQLRAHKKQTLFLTHLTSKTLPKGLHCLPLRLTTEYFMLSSSQQHFPNQEKLEDPKLYHYAIFSDNILAAAVVVNSTLSHLKDSSNHVFHIVTDKLNFAAMRMWFLANPPKNATIEVQNVEDFTWLNSSYSPVLKQLSSPSMIDYYFRGRRANSDPNVKFRNPKYLSIMNHLRFYLPEIFPKLKKVLFLDDDVVVQKDLTPLWSVNMKGKVISVVETCGENFHRFDRYLNFSNPLISKNFNPRACGWAFGMNMFDLTRWRSQNITEVYHSWQNLNHDRQLWKLGTLPPGLITFWNQTYALDRTWHVLGLGYDPMVNQKEIAVAAVIHYNGNLKPWLEISIPKFRNHWSKFIDYDQVYLRECNVNSMSDS
ncbi:unnamed protein product [Cuscuta epithymum]|uniref:Hexosyltransferase n=1 Tax=Cuscuta epithymum TaxID=186058 RepID=A0AAV0E1A0_9ASTE|nr:unnamed protein product [Cuscuta epithymum]CAH9133765.1 unnamed protein product [Cuscuta epithymum]